MWPRSDTTFPKQNSNWEICGWKNRCVKHCQEGVDSGQFTLYWVWDTWLAFNPIEMVEISDTSILCFMHYQELEMQILNCNAWKFNAIKIYLYSPKKDFCLNYSSKNSQWHGPFHLRVFLKLTSYLTASTWLQHKYTQKMKGLKRGLHY